MTRIAVARGGFALALLAATWIFLAPFEPSPQGFPGQDKVAHVAIFVILTILALSTGLVAQLVVAALAVYGGVIEVVQGLMPFDRSADLLDLLADALGIGLGIVLWLVLVRRIATWPGS